MICDFKFSTYIGYSSYVYQKLNIFGLVYLDLSCFGVQNQPPKLVLVVVNHPVYLIVNTYEEISLWCFAINEFVFCDYDSVTEFPLLLMLNSPT